MPLCQVGQRSDSPIGTPSVDGRVQGRGRGQLRVSRSAVVSHSPQSACGIVGIGPRRACYGYQPGQGSLDQLPARGSGKPPLSSIGTNAATKMPWVRLSGIEQVFGHIVGRMPCGRNQRLVHRKL